MIPTNLYQQILEYLPIFCIDLVLYHQGKVLLTYRTQQPAKDQWWIQGGRVFKNETFSQAVQRLAKREIGIEVEILNQIGTYEVFFEQGILPTKTGIHDVAVCFLVKPKDKAEIKLDPTHQQWKWIDKIEAHWHPYVKTVLEEAKIF